MGKVRKVMASVAIGIFLIATASVAADSYMDDKFALRVTTKPYLYQGMYVRYTLDSVEIGNSCTILERINRTWSIRGVDYGSYVIEVVMHKWDDQDIYNWYYYRFKGKEGSFMLLSNDLEGIWIIEVYLYENGKLVESMHICHNFSKERLRFF